MSSDIQPIPVLVAGALGRMGSEVIKSINSSKNYHIPYLSQHAKSTIYNILFDIDAVIPTYKKSYFHHLIVFDALEKILNIEDFNSIKIT